MAYILQKDESVSDGIRRVITEKIETSLEYLHENDEQKRDDAILEARTSFKRIRAALRLVREEIGENSYQQQNTFYRDIARQLSPIRDAFVVIETLDTALTMIDDPAIQEGCIKIRTLLVADYEKVRIAFWEQDILPETIIKLESALSDVEKLHMRKSGFKAMEAGLFKAYRKGYEMMPVAYANVPDIEPFHEWRKWIKYLRYQLQLLKPIREDVLAPYIKEIKQLADYLGDAHDFTVLKEHISPLELTQSGAGRQFLAQLDYLRGQLEREAKPLAEDIYREEPEKFVKRIKGYWKKW